MSAIVFDIETGPRPWEEIEQYWDESSVKLGQLKDPAKIQEKIEIERVEFLEKAALSPITGKVLAIGYRRADKYLIDDRPEALQLKQFWQNAAKALGDRTTMVGHNIYGFDLPFLVRRSWVLGIPVPAGMIDKDRYWHSIFVDTMVRWTCGKYGEWCKLDTLGRLFCVGQKPDGIDGADFHRLWHGNQAERKKAKEYLRNDLDLTWAVALRMGIAV